MKLSYVISGRGDDAVVTSCNDYDRLPAERRLRIDFGEAAFFVRIADVPQLVAELQRVRREALAQPVEVSEFIPL